MAHADVIVLGAGIVGTSIALHLAKRGLAVALIDRRGPGEETSYGNAGIVEGNTVFPPAFPADPAELLRIALKRMTPPSGRLAIPCRMAFSTSGCRRSGGSGKAIVSFGTSSSM